MYLIGASGHAKAVLDLLIDRTIVKGIYDDDITIKSILGHEVISPIPNILPSDAPYIIAIGHNLLRKNIKEARLKGQDFVNVIHSSAILSKYIVFGTGNIVMELAIVKVGSSIGNHVILNTKSSVDHDCIIEDYVHLAPGAVLCGGVSIGEGTLVGASAVILPNIKIGKWCTIAAGSVVHQSMADGQVWIGQSLKSNTL